MTDKPILDIEINDDAFTAFQKKFDRYKKELDQTGPQWSQASQRIKELEASFKGLQAHALEHQALLVKSQQHTGAMAAAAQLANDAFFVTVRGSRTLAHNILASTLQLAKWSSLTALFSGLIGAGGLWGIDRLALVGNNAVHVVEGGGYLGWFLVFMLIALLLLR